MKVMPSSAIESTNPAVDNVISQWSQGSVSRKGMKYSIFACISCDRRSIVVRFYLCTNTTFAKKIYIVFNSHHLILATKTMEAGCVLCGNRVAVQIKERVELSP